MLWSSLLLALALSTSPPPLTVVQDRCEALVAALASHQQSRLNALAVGGVARGEPWFGARDVVERFDRVAVERWRVAGVSSRGGDYVVDLEMTGRGRTFGQVHEERPLPRWWVVELALIGGDWRIVGAQTLERARALPLAEAGATQLATAWNGDSRLDRLQFLRHVGDVASNRGAAGLPALEWALGQAHSAGDSATEAAILRYRSYSSVMGGESDEALRWAQAAQEPAARSGLAEEVAASRFQLGVCYWVKGDIPRAVELAHVGPLEFARMRDPRRAFRAQYMAALLDDRLGRLREEVRFADELRAQIALTPWLPGEMDVAFLATSTYDTLHDMTLAEAAANRALTAARELGDRRAAAMAAFDLALAHGREGKADARQRLEEAAEAARSPEVEEAARAVIIRTLAERLLADGDIPGAMRAAREAVSMTDRHDVLQATALATLADVELREGDVVAAAAHAREAQQKALIEPSYSESASSIELWPIQTTMAHVLLAQGESAAAEAALRRAVDDIDREQAEDYRDSMARARLLASSREPYDELLALLADQGRGQEALEVLERARARGLADLLAQASVDRSPELADHETRRERELAGQVATLNRQLLAALGDPAGTAAVRPRLDAARQELDGFRAQLYVRHPRLALRRQPIAPARKTALAVLAPGRAVLEFAVLDREIVELLVRRRGGQLLVSVHRVPLGRDALGRVVKTFARQIEMRDPAFAGSARRLHELLVAPFVHLLYGIDALAVVPDGVLWRVPFAALQEADGRPLVHRMDVFRAPSLHLLAHAESASTRGASIDRAKLLAYGDPRLADATSTAVRAVERDARLGSLPAAAREVKAIGALYASRAQVRIGAAARESTFEHEASGFDVLHLATHGFVDDGAPMYSALVLAADPHDTRDDGLLEAREIADLHLKARLAVLSACDSGSGAIESGEGVIGLAWAFLAAGVPTVIVSERNVPSPVTASMMVELHRRLLAGDSPARALRRAQLSVRRDRRLSHPYYWASFDVLGAGW